VCRDTNGYLTLFQHGWMSICSGSHVMGLVGHGDGEVPNGGKERNRRSVDG
jgi:hypothetical protein